MKDLGFYPSALLLQMVVTSSSRGWLPAAAVQSLLAYPEPGSSLSLRSGSSRGGVGITLRGLNNSSVGSSKMRFR